MYKASTSDFTGSSKTVQTISPPSIVTFCPFMFQCEDSPGTWLWGQALLLPPPIPTPGQPLECRIEIRSFTNIESTCKYRRDRQSQKSKELNKSMNLGVADQNLVKQAFCCWVLLKWIWMNSGDRWFCFFGTCWNPFFLLELRNSCKNTSAGEKTPDTKELLYQIDARGSGYQPHNSIKY